MRLWVTGATGYLGSALVAAAREQGLEVDTERVEVRDEEAVRAHVVQLLSNAVVTRRTVRSRPRLHDV